MLLRRRNHIPSVCPKTAKLPGRPRKHRFLMWIFPIAGLFSLIWFLIRVLPKPSRATYPCQRIAMPIASGFVAWILALITSTFAYRKAKRLFGQSRSAVAVICLAVAALAALVALANMPDSPALADVYASNPHGPMGVAKGIHPGRVVWVYDPNATDWDGYSSPEHWWQSNHTDLAIVEKMVSQAIRGVAGKSTDAAAWDAIFTYFNQSRGNGDIGYQPAQKIAIKINLTTCNAHYWPMSPFSYDKSPDYINNIDNSPQMILSLLRQLVYTVGMDPNDITIGDPTGMVPNYYWNMLHPEFPDVNYLDNYGAQGRTRTEFSNVPFYWSTSAANGKVPDLLPTAFAEADYIINFAILKGHAAGVTNCAKNHYGSMLRCPDGYLRDAGYRNYYNLHNSLPMAGSSPGLGHYRALVDLMGHSQLGGKTVLYLIDGLFAGYRWEAEPRKWTSAPFGDGVNGDWPSSLFASQDPVAIDSVAYDFVLEEWPTVVDQAALEGGAEDYLHEAAEANNPPSGTFYDPDHPGNVTRLPSLGVHEHWNNPTDKQYSRNLGTGNGIELLALTSQAIAGDFDSDGHVNFSDFPVLALAWQSRPGDENWDMSCDISDPNDNLINALDLAVFAGNWLH